MTTKNRLLLGAFLMLFFSRLDAQTPMFRSITSVSGLQRAIHGNGVTAADFDNDGWVDIYFVTRSPNVPGVIADGENMLFKNNCDGTFRDVAAEAGVQGINASSVNPTIAENYGASWGDFDNDGDADLYLTNKGVDEFYENLGDGTFANITHAARLDSILRESTTAAWFDYNNDGRLDLYVGAYGAYGIVPSSENVLYRNNGDRTFTDVTATAGVGDPSYTYTTMILDANDDGWQDIYCVNDFGANYFYLNNGDGTFREATEEYGLKNDGHGMGATLGDYDNDGRLDIYLTNISDDPTEEWNPLFKKSSSGTFTDVSQQSVVRETGWAWGVEFLDFDLDGNLDIYVVNGFQGNLDYNRLFRNLGNGTFTDISHSSGTDNTEEARGLCVADFDNDGRLEMLVANWRTSASLYSSNIEGGNYLEVDLVGTKSNRDARGAIVSVEANDHVYYRPNDGIEFLGQSKVPIHFGLGDATLVHKLHVKWPSGDEQDFVNIPVNQSVTVVEGTGIITDVTDTRPATPAGYFLYANYPNPARTLTNFRVQLPSTERVQLEIYDLLGRKVATAFDQVLPAGTHSVRWTVADQSGHTLSSGVYLVRMQTQKLIAQKKFLVIK